jgi:hypothetical protein
MKDSFDDERGVRKMLNIRLIGIGAAGNKAAIHAVEKGVVTENELLLINNNLGDIPQAYKNLL